MGINWKDPKTVERLIPALLAAHPGFMPNYNAIATYFGQGASYDSIEGRFRTYRKTAKEMSNEIPRSDIPTTPRRRGAGALSTPRTANGRVTKPGSSSKKTAKLFSEDPDTPTKKGKPNKVSMSETIVLDDEDEDEDAAVNNKYNTTTATAYKRESTVSLLDPKPREVKKKNVCYANDDSSFLGQGGNVDNANLATEWAGGMGSMDFTSQDFAFSTGFGELDDTV